jgi:di/tricarboxylate transporter
MHELGQVLLHPGAQINLVVLQQLEKDLPTVRRKGMAIANSVLVVLLGTVALEKTGLLTEVMNNAATVALLISVAGQLATGLGQPPLAFVCAVLFGASQSFLSPVSYQTSLMVFGPGRYRFLDISR